MAPARASVRRRIFALVLVCIVPGVLASAVAVIASWLHEHEVRVQRSASTAQAIAQRVDRELATAITALRALSTSQYLASGDLEAFHAQARSVLPYADADEIALEDSSGRQLLNSSRPYGTPLPLQPDRALEHVFRTGQPAVSNLLVDGTTGQAEIAVDVPVSFGDSVRYALSMKLTPARFADVLVRMPIDPGWVVSVLDGAGVVVARSREAQRFVGQPLAAEVVSSIAAHPEGALDTSLLDGRPSRVLFSRSIEFGWTVLVAVPSAPLAGDLRNPLVALAATAAALLAIGILFAHRIASGIERSVRSLIEPAAALGRGEAVTVRPLELQETEEVARALREASNLLHRRTEERDHAALAHRRLEEHASRLEHDAKHDSLTGLLNRVEFEAGVERRVAACRADGADLAVLYIDVDDFKTVNDCYGHAAGDELLRLFGARLSTRVRGGDLVARLGGDEFAIALGPANRGAVEALAAEFAGRLAEPYVLRKITIGVSGSIGVAFLVPEDTVQSLLEAADTAMYAAKVAGKHRYVVAARNSLPAG